MLESKSSALTSLANPQQYGTRYRIRTGVNAVKGHYPGPLDEPSVKQFEVSGQ